VILSSYFVPIARLFDFPWNLFGILFLAAGLVLNIRADSHFKSAETTVKPFQESNALVTSGVFKFSRNPMYVGMALALAGIAILLGTLSPWPIVVIFVVVLDQVFIRKEEVMLSKTFGEDFEQYRQRVRRWI